MDILDGLSTDKAECRNRAAGAIWSLVNARDLQLECARVLPVLMYGSETMLWKEKERSGIRAAQMDNHRGLLGIRRRDKVPNTRIKKLCGVTKEVDERFDKGVLRWFNHMERMEIDKIAKKVYVGECAGSLSVGKPRKRWIDTVKDCLKKSGLDVRQARRMVQDRSV